LAEYTDVATARAFYENRLAELRLTELVEANRLRGYRPKVMVGLSELALAFAYLRQAEEDTRLGEEAREAEDAATAAIQHARAEQAGMEAARNLIKGFDELKVRGVDDRNRLLQHIQQIRNGLPFIPNAMLGDLYGEFKKHEFGHEWRQMLEDISLALVKPYFRNFDAEC
jgi:hypothetical protein